MDNDTNTGLIEIGCASTDTFGALPPAGEEILGRDPDGLSDD
ncbi:hypothetical protein [Novosphingobium terrae]|nr:hypothetical protein [Novosphingobium terrae]